jgi:dUTP pyrophosphatase
MAKQPKPAQDESAPTGDHDVEIPILRLPSGEKLEAPRYAKPGDSGMDLRSAFPGPVEITPGERRMFPTGFAWAIPRGLEGQVRSRSGLANIEGLVVLNQPGTVDSSYRGEVCVVLYNAGRVSRMVNRGDRIAQMVICPVMVAKTVPAESLDETERGEAGFGSTGRS